MVVAQITLQNLMQWDDTLFDNIVLPANVDPALVVNTIMAQYGEQPVIYPDWPVFRFTAENWFAAHHSQIAHLFADYMATYDPVFNKDAYFEETRSPDLLRSRSSSDARNRTTDQTQTNTQNSTTNATENPGEVSTESGSRTTQYQGFNSTSFNNVDKEIPGRVITASGTNTGNSTTTGSDSLTGKVVDAESATNNTTEYEQGTETITRHEYGNIGVVTAADVISKDLKLWAGFSFYDMVAKLFAVDNLIMIY